MRFRTVFRKKFRAVFAAGLCQQVVNVKFHGPVGNEQRLRNFRAGFFVQKQLHDFLFSGREFVV